MQKLKMKQFLTLFSFLLIPVLCNANTEAVASLTFIDTSNIEKDATYTAPTTIAIFETLPAPTKHPVFSDKLFSLSGAYYVKRPIGKVELNEKGYTHFNIPANRKLNFVLLDKDGNTIKRMVSTLTLSQNSTTTCIGCHKNHSSNPKSTQIKLPSKLTPKTPTPFSVSGVLDFVRDIQPILTEHCAPCHNPTIYAGKLDLSDGMGTTIPRSYYFLQTRRQIEGDSSTSKLVGKFLKHKGVKLADKDIEKLKLWLDMDAPHASSYTALDSGMIGYYTKDAFVRPDAEWDEVKQMAKSINSRCAMCHSEQKSLPTTISGNETQHLWNWLATYPKTNPRNKMSPNAVFNITIPENSPMLIAPLAKRAGGRADPKKPNSHPVIFNSKADPDYQAILSAIKRANKYITTKSPRYTSPNFKPTQDYIEAMQSSGVSKDFLESKDFNIFKCDEQYWKIYNIQNNQK